MIFQKDKRPYTYIRVIYENYIIERIKHIQSTIQYYIYFNVRNVQYFY